MRSSRSHLLAAAVTVLAFALAPAAARAATYVDVASTGGACSDARTAAQRSRPIRARPRSSSPSSCATSHLRFEGLRFSGTMNLVCFGNDHIEFAGNDLTNAVNIRGSRDILFEGNHFHDGPDSCTVDSSEAGGVRSMTGTQNLTIRGNRFERLTGDAIQMDGTGVLVEGNTFDHIQVRRGCSAHTDVVQSLGAEDVTIRGNVARDNDSGILNSSADHQTSGWTIENNVFARSSGTPLQLDNQMDDLVVANNTFSGSGVGVLFRWWTNPGVPVNSQGFVIANNVFGDGYSVDSRLNVALADYNLVPAGAHRYGPHDIAADPRFVDAAANRFDLRADSPAVDSGVAGVVATIRGAAYGVPANDLLGGARTALHDRGAYELGGGIGDPPAPAPAPDTDPAPTPDPPAAEPAPPAPPVSRPARPRPRPAPVPPAPHPAPALPTPLHLIDVQVPRVVLPGSSARLRAALRACAKRHTGASRDRCRAAARARLAPAARFSLDRAATVTVALSTDAAAPRELGRTTVAAHRGPNAVALAARHGLRPGRYRVTLTAVAGGRPAAVAVQTITVRRG